MIPLHHRTAQAKHAPITLATLRVFRMTCVGDVTVLGGCVTKPTNIGFRLVITRPTPPLLKLMYVVGPVKLDNQLGHFYIHLSPFRYFVSRWFCDSARYASKSSRTCRSAVRQTEAVSPMSCSWPHLFRYFVSRWLRAPPMTMGTVVSTVGNVHGLQMPKEPTHQDLPKTHRLLLSWDLRLSSRCRALKHVLQWGR